MKKIIKNKKGFLTDFIVDFWSLIAFVVILLLFFMIFSIQFGGCPDKAREITIVSEGSENINEKMTLMNYMKSPYDSEMTVAEKIAESHLSGDYREIKEHTLNFFDQLDQEIHEDERCSVFCIFEGDSKILEIKTDSCHSNIVGDYCEQNRMMIPLELADEKRTLIVALSYNTASSIQGAYPGYN